MVFRYYTLHTCAEIRGAAVVIDVLRAFTTAAYAFAGGASRILLTSTVEEAFDLRRRFPGSQIMGEVDGLKVPGFDFGNSPAELDAADIHARTLIHRTSHGTQGVALSTGASPLLVAGFPTAGATAAFLQQRAVEQVAFVITGALSDERFSNIPITQGDEDAACADYLAARLSSPLPPDPRPYLERVRRAPTANKFIDPEQADFPPLDLDYCTRLNVFDFAMLITHQDDLLILNRTSLSQ
jgi:2-phosphosulfolactate phosphatase